MNKATDLRLLSICSKFPGASNGVIIIVLIVRLDREILLSAPSGTTLTKLYALIKATIT